MKTIGEEMREARERAGLTAYEIGLKVGAREGQISTWERGVVNPGPEARAAYVAKKLMSASAAHAPFKAAA